MVRLNKNSPTNPNFGKKMSVDVQSSFRGIQKMNDEALSLLEKGGRIPLRSKLQRFPGKVEQINGNLLRSDEEKKCIVNSILEEMGMSKFVSMLSEESLGELRKILRDR